MASEWIEVGRVEDVPLRGARRVRSASDPIAVFRTGEGEVFALVDRCPHRGGPLSEGIVSGKTVACPLHNWVIDLASGEAQAPDIGCAPRIEVKVHDGRIFLAKAAFGGEGASAARWQAA